MEFSDYDAAEVLVKATPPRLVQGLHRIYAALYKEKTVVLRFSQRCS
jgi:hypothetical protein